MADIVNTDQVALGQSRLINIFSELPNISKILSTYTGACSNLEDLWFELLEERSLTTAVGAQLDLLGKLIVEQRRGRGDDEYRVAILAKIGVNNSEGTALNITDFISGLTGAETIKIFQHFPASTTLQFNSRDLILNPKEVAQSVDSVHSAGVGTALLHDRYDSAFTPIEIESFVKDLEILDLEEGKLLEVEQEGESPRVLEVVNDLFRNDEGSTWKGVLPEVGSFTTLIEGSIAACPEVLTTGE